MVYLLEQPDMSRIRGRRNLTLMVVLYDTDARVQELIHLKVCEVRLGQPAIITLTDNGNKERVITIFGKTRSIIVS